MVDMKQTNLNSSDKIQPEYELFTPRPFEALDCSFFLGCTSLFDDLCVMDLCIKISRRSKMHIILLFN